MVGGHHVKDGGFEEGNDGIGCLVLCLYLRSSFQNCPLNYSSTRAHVGLESGKRHQNKWIDM